MERFNYRELQCILTALTAQCESRRTRLEAGTLDEDRTVEVEDDLRVYQSLVRAFEREQAEEARRAEQEAARYAEKS